MKNIKILAFIFISLILSLVTQIILADIDYTKLINSDDAVKLNISSYAGYDKNGNTFTAINNDPQLYINTDINICMLEIKLSKPLSDNMFIQAFYSRNGEELSEEKSVRLFAVKDSTDIFIELPYSNYNLIRLDIGTDPGQQFELDQINAFSIDVSVLKKMMLKIKPDITIVLLIIFLIFLYLFNKYKNNNHRMQQFFIAFSFIIFLFCSLIQPFNSCPDESMRYDVINYIFNYNKLPHGGDPLILNPSWGISYAFVPYLSGMISSLFVKLMSLITLNFTALIFAARFTSVLAGTVCVYFIIRISEELFKEKKYQWLFIITTACLPQFMFLGSYINNDMMSLMSLSIIIYSWIKGIKNKWDYKILLLFSTGLAICILSYYNAYGYVLVSVFLFIFTSANLKLDKKEIFKKFVLVFAVTFALSGWFFIRNAVLYDGDFLGMTTVKQYSEMYALDAQKPSIRATPHNMGKSLQYMLFDMNWLRISVQSFIGIFGNMSIKISNWMYIYYLSLFALGFLSNVFISIFNLAVKIKRKNEKIDINKMIFEISLFTGGFISFLLSVYNSFFSDFQPQGRYFMSFIFPLVYFTVKGYKALFTLDKSARLKLSKLCYIFIALNIMIYLVSVNIIIQNYIL